MDYSDRKIIKSREFLTNLSVDERYWDWLNTIKNYFVEHGENNFVEQAEYSFKTEKETEFADFVHKYFHSYNFLSLSQAVVLEKYGSIWISHNYNEKKLIFTFNGRHKWVKDTITKFNGIFIPFAESKNISWLYKNGSQISSHSVELYANEIHQEYYPKIKKPLDEFFEEYKNSSSSVLILIGPPGTGKTNFIRNLLIKGNYRGYVAYDPDVFSRDEFFTHLFFYKGPAAVVLEDADSFLTSRSDGNNLMHMFLNVSDGLVSARNKKIIFSTNLASLNNVDDALVREGRCFDVLYFDKLTRDEAIKAYKHIKPDEEFNLNGTAFTLAELFNAKTNKIKKQLGFEL